MSYTEPNRPLSVEYLSLSTLELDPRNPRQHSDRQIKQIARSIESFGFNVPVLIDRENRILAGHGRMLAARSLGLQELPVIRLEGLTNAQARAFAIADNRLTENSTWDDRLLGEIFAELASVELHFSLEDTGFSMAEIDLKIEGLTTAADGPDPADQLPAPSHGPAVTMPGDLWLLGKHRVLCADALEPASYATLMQGRRARMVFTDPPYNVKIPGNVSGKGRIRHRDFAMASGEMSAGQFTHFLAGAMHLLVRHSVSGSLHLHCIDWRHMGEMLAAGAQAYTELKQLVVWVKNTGGMGSMYRSRHELVFVYKAGRAAHRNNVELGRFGRNRTNVWEYPGANTFSRTSEEGNLLALHPTVKPVALVADAILDCTARGDIVLDSFLGSGSTVIAAERVGRICYGLELDPLYVDTIVRRWQRYKGEAAIHEASGQRFDEREAAAARTKEVAHG